LTPYAIAHIAKLPNLKILIMDKCVGAVLGLQFLQRSNLQDLSLEFCEIGDPLMPTICSFESLEKLNLRCNRITDEQVDCLTNLQHLKSLNLSMNPNFTDKMLFTLKKMNSLTYVNLNFNNLLSTEGLLDLSKHFSDLKIEMIGCDKALNQSKQRHLILLVEDSFVQSRLIKMVLYRYNFDVELAIDGEQALNMFKANPKYDLILLDLKMPKLGGLECLHEIREEEKLRGLNRTPIIIQTAGNDDDDDQQKLRCFEEGADEYVLKPLDKSSIQLAKELINSSKM